MRDGWRQATLGELADINPEVVDLRRDRTVSYVDLSAVSADHGINLSAVPRVRLSEAPGRARRGIRSDDVLVATVRPYLRGFAVVPAELDGEVASTGFCVLRARPHVAAPGFLWLLVTTDSFVGGLMVRAAGSNYPAVRPIDIAEQSVPVPPLAEQRRIVDLIVGADASLNASDALYAAARAAVNAIREQLIDWSGDLVPLHTLCSIQGRLVDPTEPALRDLGHIGIERIEARTGRLLPLKSATDDGVTSGKFLVDERDLVYSKIRPELRKAALPGFRALCSADAYPLRPAAGVDPRFLLELLLSDQFSARAIGKSGRTKMPKVNRNELMTIRVPFPDRGYQVKVGDLASALREVADTAASHAAALRALRAALLGDLLRGNHPIPASYDRFLDGVA